MKKVSFTGVCLTLLVAAACQQPPTTTVTTNTSPNANVSNSNLAANGNLSGSTTTSNTVTVDAREPEQYQATVSFRLETIGAQNSALPPLVAQVARNGGDKRMEFTLPGGEKVVYLDRADKRLLILPNRKQYAELNAESTGFDVRRMLSPAQMVEQVKNQKGIERVGEEQFNGRTAVRYRYGAVTDTKSQAGQVETQSYFLVDKDTGLPLRSETVSESTTGGNVQGVSGLRIVTETSNIQTNAPAELFAEPTDYKKVAPEEVRGQITTITNMALAIFGQIMRNNQAPQASPATTPAAPGAANTNSPRP